MMKNAKDLIRYTIAVISAVTMGILWATTTFPTKTRVERVEAKIMSQDKKVNRIYKVVCLIAAKSYPDDAAKLCLEN